MELEEQIKEATAQNDLMVSADTKANGLFTMTPQLTEQNIAALSKAGLEITAEQLFDMSILEEVYAENPELI